MRNGTMKIATVVIGLAGVVAASSAIASDSVSAAQMRPCAGLSYLVGDDVKCWTMTSGDGPPRELRPHFGGDMHW